MKPDKFLQEVEADLINRPEISQKVIDGFVDIIDAQDRKGFKKYGRSIDDAIDEDYDWRIMALEECADQLKYLVREVKLLEKQLKEEKKKRIYLEKLHSRKLLERRGVK